MAYHQWRLVALVSHQSVRAVYHHTFRCVSKMLSQWWYTTVSTVDDIHGVAVMICNSLRNWLYTMLRIDFNKNMCYYFVEKEVILCLRTIWLFIQNNSQLISHCCVKELKHQATLFSKFICTGDGSLCFLLPLDFSKYCDILSFARLMILDRWEGCIPMGASKLLALFLFIVTTVSLSALFEYLHREPFPVHLNIFHFHLTFHNFVVEYH